MDSWNSTTVLNFLLAHARQRILIRERGTTMKMAGHLAAVGDRNACSMDLVEADLETGVPGLHCAITLHETTLLIHLSGASTETPFFVPVSIPYADLVLEGGETNRPTPGVESSSSYERL
jgi:hypothetical protein